jgi:protein involved in sex pheromone biosynthesis
MLKRWIGLAVVMIVLILSGCHSSPAGNTSSNNDLNMAAKPSPSSTAVSNVSQIQSR